MCWNVPKIDFRCHVLTLALINVRKVNAKHTGRKNAHCWACVQSIASNQDFWICFKHCSCLCWKPCEPPILLMRSSGESLLNWRISVSDIGSKIGTSVHSQYACGTQSELPVKPSFCKSCCHCGWAGTFCTQFSTMLLMMLALPMMVYFMVKNMPTNNKMMTQSQIRMVLAFLGKAGLAIEWFHAQHYHRLGHTVQVFNAGNRFFHVAL